MAVVLAPKEVSLALVVVIIVSILDSELKALRPDLEVLPF